VNVRPLANSSCSRHASVIPCSSSGFATWLLERNTVHVIASDAHDDKHRKPILSEARDAVSKSFGADFAQALVLENPAAIIAGLPLPSSREPSRDTSQKFIGKIG
jgi:tyrosine-protein phosphatase YwqE